MVYCFDCKIEMEILLKHIRETSGRETAVGCAHGAKHICSGCFKMAYCGIECQEKHWHQEHKYECIGGNGDGKREREEGEWEKEKGPEKHGKKEEEEKNHYFE